jgi:putative transposase
MSVKACASVILVASSSCRAAAMQEAARGFRRLKAHKQLPTLRAALEAHHNKDSHGVLARQAIAA